MSKQRKDKVSPVVDPFASNNASTETRAPGGQNPAFLLPQVDENDGLTNFNVGAYEPYIGSTTSKSLFNDKARARAQSGFEQAGHALIQATKGEILGGTISAVGSIGAFFTDILTEGGRQEADFNNSIMQIGENLMQSSRENNPIYRVNPGKAFDMEDKSGWFWEGVPSVASSLSMLIPARGVAGGLGMIGKMLNVTQKMGKTAKFIGTAATMAVVSRNAENMRESLGVAQTANEKVKEELGGLDEADLIDYLSKNEIGKEFLQTGKPITLENYAKFSGAQAGMEAYKVNAANVVFDFVQSAMALKAISGLTRNRNITNILGGQSLKVAQAEAASLGKTLTTSQMVGIRAQNALAGTIAGSSEAVEEMINAVGTNEGNRVGDIAAGKDKSDKQFGDRLSKYLDDSHTWEAGFWGYAGGKIYQGGASLLERAINPAARVDLDAGKINEIGGRAEHIQNVAKDLEELESRKKAGAISTENYNKALSKIGQQTGFDMGLNAASTGQVDNLLSSLQDSAFKEVMMKHMSPEDKADYTDEKHQLAVDNLSNSILEAEEVYRSVNNRMTVGVEQGPLHTYLQNKAIQNSFDIIQREKENAELDDQFETLMGDPRYSSQSTNQDFRNTIEIEALNHLENTYDEALAKNKDKSAYQEFIARRKEEIEARRSTLQAVTPNSVKLTQDNADLVTIKYQQLGNEFQIANAKESNDKLFNKKRVAEVKEDLEKAVDAQRKRIKEEFNKSLAFAESNETLPEDLDDATVAAFDDEELTARYNALKKKLKENEEIAAATTPITPIQSVEAIEDDNTDDTVTPDPVVPTRVETTKDRSDGLQGLSSVQVTKFLQLAKDAYNKKDVAALQKYREIARTREIPEDSGYIQDLDRKIAELTAVEETVNVSEDVVPLPVNEEQVEDVSEGLSLKEILDNAFNNQKSLAAALEAVDELYGQTFPSIVRGQFNTKHRTNSGIATTYFKEQSATPLTDAIDERINDALEQVNKEIIVEPLDIELETTSDEVTDITEVPIQDDASLIASFLDEISESVELPMTPISFTGETVTKVIPTPVVEPVVKPTELPREAVLTPDINLFNVPTFVIGIHNLTENVEDKKSGVYTINKNTATVIEKIKSINVGAVVEIKIDNKNKQHIDSKEDAAIAAYVDGVPIMYIPTITTVNQRLEAARAKNNAAEVLKYVNMLASITAMRDKIYNNQDKTYTTTVEKITPGTLVPSNVLTNAKDVIAGSYRLGYVNPQSPNRDQLKVVGEEDTYYGTGALTHFNEDGKYTEGMFYVMLEGFNFDGSVQSRIPVRVHRAQLDETAAREVESLITQVIKAINGGATLNSEEVETLKAQIGEITAVNRGNREKSNINGALVYTIPKPYFKIHNNRIEFIFDNGTKIMTIWYKDNKSGETKIVIEEWNSKAKEFANEEEYRKAKGKVLSRTTYGSISGQKTLLDSLQKRPFNVVIPKGGLSIAEVEKMVQGGRFVGDFGVLRSENGNVSNFWGRPETALVEGIGRYQTGNLAIDLSSKLEEKGIVKKEVKQVVNEEVVTPVEVSKVETTTPTQPSSFEDLFGSGIDVQAANALLMQASGDLIEAEVSPIDRQKHWDAMFSGNVPFDPGTDELIRTKGELAYGVFTTAGGRVFKNAPMGTEYHEAFHAVTQEYLTVEQLDALYLDAANLYPNGARMTRLQLEERLAEDFRLFALNQKLLKDSPVKQWFKKIWSAIKIALGIMNRDTLFQSIYSGNFKYAPTARVREFIKNSSLSMEVNKLNSEFTQQEIKQYVEWATMIVANDLPLVTGISNREIMLNPNKYNLKLRVKAALGEVYKKAERNGDAIAQDTIKRIAENWGDVNSGFWQLIVQNTKKKLNYNISFNEDQSNNFQGNVRMQKDWDDSVPFTKSGKESFDFDLKRIIMLTPQLDNTDADVLADGQIVFTNISRPNAAKLVQPVDFNLVYPMLVVSMTDANTVEEMMARLKNLSEINPSMYYLWNKINSDQNLQQKWFTNFRKNYVEETHIRFSNLENEGYEIVKDTANKSYALADAWGNQVQVLNIAKGKTGTKYNNVTAADIKALRKDVAFYLQGKDLEKTIVAVAAYGKAIGINLSTDILMKIANNPQIQEHYGLNALNVIKERIYNNLEWVGDKVTESLELQTPYFFKERGRIIQIADLVSYYQPEVVENSYINTAGKVIYSVMKPSYLSEFFSKIQAVNNPFTVNKVAAKQAVLDEIKDRLKDKSIGFSNWIYIDTRNNGLLKIQRGNKAVEQLTIDDLNLEALSTFSFRRTGDVKQTLSGFGANYSELSENDWMLHNLVHYAASASTNKLFADYSIIVPSDSGNMWSIRARRFKVQLYENNISSTSDIYQALYNVVNQEMMRMEVASKLMFERAGVGVDKYALRPKKLTKAVKENLIIGYHYTKVATGDVYYNDVLYFQKGDPITLQLVKGEIVPTGKVFNFESMNYKVGKTKMSINSIPGIKIGGVFTRDTLNPTVRAAVKEHILGFSKQLIATEQKRHSEFSEVIKQSVTKGTKTSFLDFWSNDYNKFIGEYALNNYIFNIEQANFFNGGIAEYKNGKDTTKRAKEVSTTKQTTDTTFRGATYKALIFKDIILDAVNLKGIEANIRKTMSDEVLIEKAISKFKNINIADAQGYVTLDRLEAILKDYGRWNESYVKLFRTARNPNLELTSSDLETLMQIVKPFMYSRRFNPVTGVYSSVQIKTALLPLIPKLIKGTSLERVAAYMEKNNVGEAYFESAVKVGRQMLSDITDENGNLRPDFENNMVAHEYENSGWGLQLDVPSHLKDEQNKLGVQIAKLTMANLSSEAIYTVNGKKKTGPELQTMLHTSMSLNIEASSKELLEELGVERLDNGSLVIKDLKVISDMLTKEVQSRGLSRNFIKALQLKDGKFVVPLSGTNMSSKFMSILSSLFTNRVTNQKFPGGHVVVATPALLNFDVITGSTVVKTEGIEFIDGVKDRIGDGTFQLKYLDIVGGHITKVEALLPAWSKEFFKKGERININDLSEDMRTMIGYRIPTEGKYSTVTMEIVGFLPESSGSTIILPYELIAQTGWDFDVDSVYLMQKEFKTLVNGKEATEYIAGMTGLKREDVSKYINEIKKPTNLVEVPKAVRESYEEFVDIATEYRVIKSSNETIESRNNQIFDIYQSIYTNPNSFNELVSGGNFNDAVAVKKRVEELLGIDEDGENVYTRMAQDIFRNAFMAGRALKGMAADVNSALAVMQNAKARFNGVAFHFKYGENVTQHSILGDNERGTRTNINGDVITDHVAQILAMTLDIVKEGFPYNVNTYTFNTFMAMLATGIPIMNAGLYIRQPALNRIAQKVLNNTSVLDDIEEREVTIVKREYQAAMYQTMVKAGYITLEQMKEDKTFDKNTGGLKPLSHLKNYFSRNAVERLELHNDLTKAYTQEELEDMIRMEDKNKRNNETAISYYREQLNIIDQWQEYYMMGQEFGHIVSNLKADKIGAGPDLNVTTDMVQSMSKPGITELYYRSEEAVIVTESGQGVLDAVYEGEAYPVFKSYFEHSNLTSFAVLAPLFLETQLSYMALKNRIKENLKLKNTDEVNKKLDKFMFKALYKIYGSQNLEQHEIRRLLGIGKRKVNLETTDFETFQTLSTAEKLAYVQSNFKTVDGVLQPGFLNSFDILNRLTAKLEENLVEKRDMHSIKFEKPKSSDNVDDFVIESFEEILNSTNPYIKNLAEDLIKYDFTINGVSFGANNWREYIPMEKQIELGIGEDVKKIMNNINETWFLEFEDLFMRNSWNNGNIVPIAKSKYQYDGNGKRMTSVDEQTYEEFDTIDSTFFNWDAKVNAVQPFMVSKKQLKLEKQSIKNAKYLLVQTKDKKVLLKRYMFNNDLDKLSNTMVDVVYYYPVGKLGSFYIGNETTDTSILDFNNITVQEQVMIQQIENSNTFAIAQGELLAKKKNEKQC